MFLWNLLPRNVLGPESANPMTPDLSQLSTATCVLPGGVAPSPGDICHPTPAWRDETKGSGYKLGTKDYFDFVCLSVMFGTEQLLLAT